jgi:hypothetical protein
MISHHISNRLDKSNSKAINSSFPAALEKQLISNIRLSIRLKSDHEGQQFQNYTLNCGGWKIAFKIDCGIPVDNGI